MKQNKKERHKKEKPGKPNKPPKPNKDNRNRVRKTPLSIKLITYSLPITFFIIVEIVLRIGGYGASNELFIPMPNNEHYQYANPDIIKRYFPSNAQAPSVALASSLYLKEKPGDGLRIFVQGGSTAAGFPFGSGASIAGMLDQRIKRSFPDRTVEVINTAMSAVNSYTLLDFVDEIIEQDPDAVLIYVGHNEYLGILGVGSNFSVGNSYGTKLLFLKLKDLRLFQLLQNIYQAFRNSTSSKAVTGDSEIIALDDTSRTFMARVAKNKTIELGSDIYRQGLEQFKNNINLIIDKYQAADIPVFISTIASNIKDHKPFASKDLSSAQKQNLVQLQRQVRQKKVLRSLFQQLEQEAIRDNNAYLLFELGKLALKSEDDVKAKQLLTLAKENDLLRFRAPEAINSIIKETAAAKKIHLVDYHLAINQRAQNGIVGNEFMLEHLHPNLEGYFILADNFYQSVKSSRIFTPWVNDVSTDDALRDVPVLPVEEYYGNAKVLQLKTDYPFTNKPEKLVLPAPENRAQEIGLDYFHKKIGWIEMVNLTYQHYEETGNIPMIMKTSQIVADALPQNAKVNFRVGRQFIQTGNAQFARAYLQRAILSEPENADYQISFANSLRLTGKIVEAKESLMKFLNTLKNDSKDKYRIEQLVEQLNREL